MPKKRCNITKNYKFIESAEINYLTLIDYYERLKKVAMSIFEWVNLPEGMNAIFLEECLFEDGQCALLKDKNYGFINTHCTSGGKVNIYGLPTRLECYSLDYHTNRKLYTGLTYDSENMQTYLENSECILVQNTWDRTPTATTLNLFANRLYQAERTCDVNISAQRTPILIVVNEKQRLMMENLYQQYNGNQPFIFGDKDQLDENVLRAIKTDAPFISDKVMDYKKAIWNEALTFLGINNIIEEKKERLVQDEVNSNNELINLNLQSYLAPRKLACKQFNKKFNLEGTEKAIDVKVRSDLHNIIKTNESIITDYNKLEGVEPNG